MLTERIRPIDHPGFMLRGAYAIGRRLFGDVPTPQKVMAHHPALMLGIGALWTSIERLGVLDGQLRALLQLQVATLSDVAYWMDIRHAVGVTQGLDEATLSELPGWRESTWFSARERAALELTEALVRDDSGVSDECFARVREHFSEPETVELVFVVGYQIFASTFAKAFRLAPQGFAALHAQQGSD